MTERPPIILGTNYGTELQKRANESAVREAKRKAEAAAAAFEQGQAERRNQVRDDIGRMGTAGVLDLMGAEQVFDKEYPEDMLSRNWDVLPPDASGERGDPNAPEVNQGQAFDPSLTLHEIRPDLVPTENSETHWTPTRDQ